MINGKHVTVVMPAFRAARTVERTWREISVPTKYFDEASSINFARSVRYGFGVLRVGLVGALWRAGVGAREKFQPRHALRALDGQRD